MMALNEFVVSATNVFKFYDHSELSRTTTINISLVALPKILIMSSLNIDFSRFIDLTINPTHGTINTNLLHALLHIIVDQLRLSTSLIEFHDDGSAASIENQISLVKDDNNHHQHRCRVEVRQLEIKQEIDGEGKDAIKVFAITNNETNRHPSGYPLNPIQSISIEHFDSKVNDIVTNALPSDRSIISVEQQHHEDGTNSMKTLIDLVNATKRIDALEIVARQTAILLKEIQCDSTTKLIAMQSEIASKMGKFEAFMLESVETFETHRRSLSDKDDIIESMQAEMKALHEKLSDCKDLIENYECKCEKESYEAGLYERFHERIEADFKGHFKAIINEMENVKGIWNDEQIKVTDAMTALRTSICEQFKIHELELEKLNADFQEKLNAKLGKIDLLSFKRLFNAELAKLDGKIDNVDCKRAIAAGITKKIHKDINCVSCGDKVIQIDDVASPQLLIKSTPQHHQKEQQVEFLPGAKLSTRFCGGRHTIITAGERVFRTFTKEPCEIQKLK